MARQLPTVYVPLPPPKQQVRFPAPRRTVKRRVPSLLRKSSSKLPLLTESQDTLTQFLDFAPPESASSEEVVDDADDDGETTSRSTVKSTARRRSRLSKLAESQNTLTQMPDFISPKTPFVEECDDDELETVEVRKAKRRKVSNMGDEESEWEDSVPPQRRSSRASRVEQPTASARKSSLRSAVKPTPRRPTTNESMAALKRKQVERAASDLQPSDLLAKSTVAPVGETSCTKEDQDQGTPKSFGVQSRIHTTAPISRSSGVQIYKDQHTTDIDDSEYRTRSQEIPNSSSQPQPAEETSVSTDAVDLIRSEMHATDDASTTSPTPRKLRLHDSVLSTIRPVKRMRTPRRALRFEIPSSQSPASATFSTQKKSVRFTNADTVQRSPLKERSANVVLPRPSPLKVLDDSPINRIDWQSPAKRNPESQSPGTMRAMLQAAHLQEVARRKMPSDRAAVPAPAATIAALDSRVVKGRTLQREITVEESQAAAWNVETLEAMAWAEDEDAVMLPQTQTLAKDGSHFEGHPFHPSQRPPAQIETQALANSMFNAIAESASGTLPDQTSRTQAFAVPSKATRTLKRSHTVQDSQSEDNAGFESVPRTVVPVLDAAGSPVCAMATDQSSIILHGERTGIVDLIRDGTQHEQPPRKIRPLRRRNTIPDSQDEDADDYLDLLASSPPQLLASPKLALQLATLQKSLPNDHDEDDEANSDEEPFTAEQATYDPADTALDRDAARFAAWTQTQAGRFLQSDNAADVGTETDGEELDHVVSQPRTEHQKADVVDASRQPSQELGSTPAPAEEVVALDADVIDLEVEVVPSSQPLERATRVPATPPKKQPSLQHSSARGYELVVPLPLPGSRSSNRDRHESVATQVQRKDQESPHESPPSSPPLGPTLHPSQISTVVPTQLSSYPLHLPRAKRIKTESQMLPLTFSSPPRLRAWPELDETDGEIDQAENVEEVTDEETVEGNKAGDLQGMLTASSSPFALPPWTSPERMRGVFASDTVGTGLGSWVDFSLPPPPPLSSGR